MSGSKSRRRSSSSSSSKLNKSSNVQMFKLIDPVGQSIGIIIFIYSLDAHANIPSRLVVLSLLCWQMLSVLINLFLGEMKLLKIERALYFVLMLVYMTIYYFLARNEQENYAALNQGMHPSVSINQVIIVGVGVVIAFWYNVICYREFRKIFGAINRGNNR